MQGINNIKAKINGSIIVQQYNINWSNRILGNEALTQMKIKIMINVLNPIIKLQLISSIQGLLNKLSEYKPFSIYITSEL